MLKWKNCVAALSLLSLVFISGCDNPKKEPVNEMSGNFSAKAETLTSNNDADIRTDLTALNFIINTSNTKATGLGQKLIAAGRENDAETIRKILLESNKLLEATNNSLLGLNLKSNEVQKVRLKIYQGNAISIKASDLYMKQNKSDSDKQELLLLQKQKMVLEQSVGVELDELNSQYKMQ